MRFSILFLALLAPLAVAQDPAELADAHWRAHGCELLEEWSQLLALPNRHGDLQDMRRNAEWIREAFARRGVELELWPSDEGSPAIHGRIDSPGAKRTIGIYVHYDGQPVDRSRWIGDPFVPALRDAEGRDCECDPSRGAPLDDWRIYGRSTSDDKAPIAALLGSLDALHAADLPLRANVVFFFDGEEEAGSPTLAQQFRAHRDALQADLWLVLDGPVHSSGLPQLVFGVRGITGMELTVYGATRTLHSGHYGNWAPNPALELAQLLASMKDDDGHVLIPGFYDSSAPIDAATQAAIRALPPADDALRAELGLSATEDSNAPYLERMLLPSLNIRGFVSGTVGETARNIVPQDATASLEMRLVKGNDPQAMQDLVEAYVRERGFHVVREQPSLEERSTHRRIARIVRDAGYRAVRTPMDLPIVEWLARRVHAATDQELVMMPTLGGSLPLYVFEDELQAAVIVVPIANHDNNQHAPNENLRMGNLRYGLRCVASLLAGEDS